MAAATVDELFKLTKAELLETWRQAKVAEIEMVAHRMAAKGTDDHLDATAQVAAAKLASDTIRLVIGFRLMGRDKRESSDPEP